MLILDENIYIIIYKISISGIKSYLKDITNILYIIGEKILKI